MTDKVVASYSRGTPSPGPETVNLLIEAKMSVGGELVPMVCLIEGVHLRWAPYEMGVPAAADNTLPVQVVTIEIAQIGGRNSWMKQRCIP